MYYKQYLPCAQLTEYIECYWILRMHHPVFNKQRLVPGGRIEMIFNFGSSVSWMVDENDVTTGILDDDVCVMGQRNRIYYAAFAGSLDLMGVRFKPGGLAAFSNIPAMQLLNKLLHAENIFESNVKSWNEEILDKEHDEEKFQLLDKLMLSAFQKRPAECKSILAVIDSIRMANDPVLISAICHQTGWNYKKLERSFLKYAGYAPKQYMRIIRFNKALRQIDKTRQSLTATGFEFGYYDQAHFIKDCIQLAGTTPGRLQTDEHAIANLLVTHQPV